MKKFDVQIALEGVREAREQWKAARREFDSNMDFVMARLLHEAMVNYMSISEVAKHAGLDPQQVRAMLRKAGMNPSAGKRLLAKHAADALAENSALLGIEPHEMDLTSPLAYLPMGSEMKQQLIDARVHRVTELPEDEVSGNEPVHGINFVDDEVACGHLAYNDPVLITSDLGKITCAGCRTALVQG